MKSFKPMGNGDVFAVPGQPMLTRAHPYGGLSWGTAQLMPPIRARTDPEARLLRKGKGKEAEDCVFR